MSLKRLAILSVHTSPLAPMGGKKTGGMNVYIRELAQELGARGIAVDIFTRRSSPHEPHIDTSIGENVRVIYLTAGSVTPLAPDDVFGCLSEFTARLIAFATLRSLKYDLVYSHYWLSGWVAAKLKEAWGTPFVQMFHTLGQMKQRILAHGNVSPNQRIMTEMQIIRWADRVVAATPAEAVQLRWLYRARRQKIAVVPPGVNTARFQPLAAEDAKRALGLPLESSIFLFVGRIEPLKAVDTIIKALGVVRERDPQRLEQLHFVVVGGNPQDPDDEELQRLQQLTRELALEPHVSFVGAKDQSLLPQYYAAATAVIMPSDYESFGMVALEAMASGTPVIASRVGGLAFLVRDDETGYLIPVREPHSLADRMEMLASDVPRRLAMGQRAMRVAQEYAWSNIADRLLTIFEDVLAQRSAQVG